MMNDAEELAMAAEQGRIEGLKIGDRIHARGTCLMEGRLVEFGLDLIYSSSSMQGHFLERVDNYPVSTSYSFPWIEEFSMERWNLTGKQACIWGHKGILIRRHSNEYPLWTRPSGNILEEGKIDTIIFHAKNTDHDPGEYCPL